MSNGMRRMGRPGSAAWRAAVGALAALAVAAAVAMVGPTPASAQVLSFIRDTEIEELLNEYSRPIFKAAGIGGGRVAIRIVRHESFNAFVLDAHNVFIHTGALMQSDTPNQVIGVLAHESGHIQLR